MRRHHIGSTLATIILAVAAASACTLPGSTGPGAVATSGPADSVAEAAEVCDPDNPQPEEHEIDHILAREQEALASCTEVSHSQYIYVWFVIGRDGHARDVRVNGDTMGGLARCVSRGLGRLVFRPPSQCPTTAEFVIADSPFSGKGTSGQSMSHRPHAR